MLTPGVWTGMYAEFSLVEALRALQECGWRAFEISTEHLVAIERSSNSDMLVELALNYLEEQNLYVPQAHALLAADVANPDEQKRKEGIQRLEVHVDISARLGVKNVVMHPGRQHDDHARFLKLNAEAFRRLGDFAGERGVRICLENLTRPEAYTSSDLIGLLEQIDHPAIGITLDTSHANMCNLDVAQVVRELGPHLVATHISDNRGSLDDHLVPGGGTINWPEVMSAFREVGYKGLFNLEIPGERHANLDLRRLKSCFALEVTNWLVGLADSPLTKIERDR